MNRRQFLEYSSLGLTAALCGASTVAPSTVGKPRNLVLLFAQGGWDPAVALDPKPGLATVASPPGEIAQIGGHDVFVTEQTPSVRTFFEKHGAVSSIVRGLDLRSLSHEISIRYVLAGTSDDTAPDVAAITGATLSPERAVPYLVLGDKALPGSLGGSTGRVGLTNQLGGLLDRSIALPPLRTSPAPTPTDLDLVQGWLRERVARKRGRYAPSAGSAAVYDDFLRAIDRGNLLYDHADAFVHDQSFSGRCDLAVYALANQMSRSVLIDSQLAWDTHILASLQLEFHEEFFATFERLLDTLLVTPGESPGSTLLDETLVVALSEMGRTPHMNQGGGKDHWPYTSVVLAGGPVRGDRVFGATDENLVGVPVDFDTGEVDPSGAIVAPADFVAGILEAVGVDPAPWFPGVSAYRAPFAP